MEKKTGIEVVGVVGVIASLLFVGVQVQQSAEATRGATVLQLKENWVQLNLTMMQNPEIRDALQLVLDEGFENLDLQTQLIVNAWYRTIMHNWSNAYFQYRIGTLDDEQWQANVRDMAYESSNYTSVVWGVWDQNSYFFDDSFQTLMDSLRAANIDDSTSSRSSR